MQERARFCRQQSKPKKRRSILTAIAGQISRREKVPRARTAVRSLDRSHASSWRLRIACSERHSPGCWSKARKSKWSERTQRNLSGRKTCAGKKRTSCYCHRVEAETKI